MKTLSHSSGKARSVISQKGAAAVEFAIVISLMVLITGGIIEFGRVFWYLDALTKATRDGARYLSTSALPLDTSTAQSLVVNAAERAGLPGVVNVTVSCDGGCLTPNYVTVAITGYSVAFGSWFAMPIPAGNWAISPQTTMRYMCVAGAATSC